MFCLQSKFNRQVQEVTPELFTLTTTSDEVVRRVNAFRSRYDELQAYKQETEELKERLDELDDNQHSEKAEINKRIEELSAKMRVINAFKSGLPLFMFQASTFDPTKSRAAKRVGRWRKQSAVRLNGLFMLDVDHVDDPYELFKTMVGARTSPSAPNAGVLACAPKDAPRLTFEEKEAFCKKHNILLVHVTPSGHGLRFVAIADPKIGDIASNQDALALKLGVEKDKGCIDASRGSFCPKLDDVIYIDNEKLFDYENEEYDEKFGDQYRGGNSRPSSNRCNLPAVSSGADVLSHHQSDRMDVQETGSSVRMGEGKDGGTADLDKELKEGYHGKTYNEICAAWFQQNGGTPKTGDRHQSLYKLACDLRYITDFNPLLLSRVLMECEVGAEIVSERGQAELDRIAGDACALQRYRSLPKRLKSVLQSLGLFDDEGGTDRAAEREAAIDYGAWWARLKPLLEKSPGYREAVATLPDHLKLAGVLASGAMFGTYLSRCWWEHFDGKDYRLSFLVYIVGAAASGKSFLPEMDRLIMAPMKASDNVGREWERQYKEDMKKRSVSTKNAKQEAPDQQHPCIRYVPSTISNAMLYRRLTDAIDVDAKTPDGQSPLHLHLYTMEPELATALRAQQGSWAAKNDLELKSFHNEYAGVDYANDASVNGIIQVNWNQVVTGTPESMGRKIKPSMVLDGLVTRLVLFPMPDNDFVMIDRRKIIRDHDRDCFLRSVGITLEQVKGELKADRLVDFCYDYEAKLTNEARLEEDYCLDYFRKRIPVIMMRYALVRMVLRQLDNVRKGEPLVVEDDDLEFARLIGDWCLMAQIRMFGNMVMDAQEREKNQFVPRKRSTKTREAYAALPKNFKVEDVVKEDIAKNMKRAQEIVRRWLDDGLIVKSSDGYTKLYDVIPE